MLKGSEGKDKLFTSACIYIIIVAWALNIVISVSRTFKKVYDKIKEILVKRRLNKIKDSPQTKETQKQAGKNNFFNEYDLN